MTDRSFGTFLTRSLQALQRELPTASARMVELLGGREVWIHAEGSGVSVYPRAGSAGSRLLILDRPQRPAVTAEASRQALCELLEARYSLAEAIYNDKILLQGELDDLLAFQDALDVYFCGAVRCPSFPAILDDYLGPVQGRAGSARLPDDFQRL